MHHAMLEGCTADKCADGMDIMLLAGDSFFEGERKEGRADELEGVGGL
jgi:hypothetical protein